MRSIVTLFLICTSFTASAQIDSGFEWLHPRPTGEQLWDVQYIAPDSYVAVSDNGFLYRTTDNGLSWQKTGTEVLGQLLAIDSRYGLTIATGKGGRTHRSFDNGETWKISRVPNFSENLRDVQILDSTTIVAVGSTLSRTGTIVRSTDRGESWTVIQTGYTIAFRSVSFIDSLYGFAVGDPGMLLWTSDGGLTWSRDTSAILTGASFQSVRFHSPDTGVISGDYGRLFTTHDGGQTWIANPQWTSSTLYAIDWVNDKTVVVVGQGQQVRSTDAGKTWNEMVAGSQLLGVDFEPSGSKGIAVGNAGEIKYTNDGGLRWTSRTQGIFGFNIYDLDFLDSLHGIAVGYQAAVMYTTDGGVTWARSIIHPNTSPGHLTGVIYVAPDNIIALAEEGHLFRSTDGGKNWSGDLTKTTNRLYDMSFSSKSIGWAVGNGVLLKTLDGGAHWNQEPSLPFQTWAVDAVTDSLVYVTGANGQLYYTRDGGGTWEQIPNEFTVRFTFVKADTNGSITMGWQGGLVHSDDNGETWTDNRAPDGSDIRGFSFLTPDYGWSGQELGPILSTTDAGATWVELEHGIRTSPTGNAGMAAVDLESWGTGYVAGSNGMILDYQVPEVSGIEDEAAPMPVLIDLSFLDLRFGRQ